MTTTKKTRSITSLIAKTIRLLSSMIFTVSNKSEKDARKAQINKLENIFGKQYQKRVKKDNTKSK